MFHLFNLICSLFGFWKFCFHFLKKRNFFVCFWKMSENNCSNESFLSNVFFICSALNFHFYLVLKTTKIGRLIILTKISLWFVFLWSQLQISFSKLFSCLPQIWPNVHILKIFKLKRGAFFKKSMGSKERRFFIVNDFVISANAFFFPASLSF